MGVKNLLPAITLQGISRKVWHFSKLYLTAKEAAQVSLECKLEGSLQPPIRAEHHTAVSVASPVRVHQSSSTPTVEARALSSCELQEGMQVDRSMPKQLLVTRPIQAPL